MSTASTPRPAQPRPDPATALRTVHYVFSTHWDREWYQPFQHYRIRLVQLIDRVIEGINSGEFRGPFQMDGQTILLEDYLEIRPERRGEVESLVRSGKFIVGPWYVLPDEFLVSGESIVRNFRKGRAVARAFGAECSTAGFVCDLFGHVSQLPQILAGFGVRGVFLWRGINPRGTRNLRWRGADGTTLPAYHFGRRGYCDYASDVRGAMKFDERPDVEEVKKNLDSWLERETGLTIVDPILAFDGGDHQEWEQHAYRVVSDAMDKADSPFEVLHSSLDAYLDEMLPQADRITEEVVGELREPGKETWAVDEQWVIPGVASSRVWIKQRNAHCQTMLTRWLEPLSVLAKQLLGVEIAQGYLDTAWTWLLKNHPHDSIGGCSVDRVHEDMKFRFSQCEQITEQLSSELAGKLTASVEGDVPENEVRVGVFNPRPRRVQGLQRLVLEIPAEWPSYNEFFGFEPKPAFRLRTPGGEEVPYQLVGITPGRRVKRIEPYRFPVDRRVHRVEVVADLDLPATGFTTLRIERGEEGKPTRHPVKPGLVRDPRTLESETLRVEVTHGGTLKLTDRRTGRIYEDLLTFEDTADIGDGWYHGQTVNEQAITSSASACDVTIVADGPMMAAMRLRTKMNVPSGFDAERRQRSEERVPLVIDTTVRLLADRDELDVETTVNNSAKDHRLRVLFPSGCSEAQTCFSDSAFDVVERGIVLRDDNHTYRELEIETRPQQSWTAVHDAEGGLAVVADGLIEATVRDLTDRPVALTLFRGTQRTVFTDGEPDGQVLGPMTFRYRILPLKGELPSARLFDVSTDLSAGLHLAHVYPNDQARQLERIGPRISENVSAVTVEGDAVLTALLGHADGVEVRVFNPTASPIHATLHLDQALFNSQSLSWVLLDLAGDPAGSSATVDAGCLQLDMTPKQITTVLIRMS